MPTGAHAVLQDRDGGTVLRLTRRLVAPAR